MYEYPQVIMELDDNKELKTLYTRGNGLISRKSCVTYDDEDGGDSREEDGKDLEEDGKDLEEDGKDLEEDGKGLEEDGKDLEEDGSEIKSRLQKSFYISDGHGDVRLLTDEEGNITDTYRYSAWGELLEKSGDTNNPYLYTEEYHDERTGFYYLRARYMNPQTGSFISMDSYQGNTNDPASLHKYTYAQNNPIMYNDPSGHFIGIAAASINSAISGILRNQHNLHVMGMISGTMNTIISQFLGSEENPAETFLKGYLMGVGFGAVYYGALAISITFSIMPIFYGVMAGILGHSTIINVVMSIICFATGNNKEGAVYASMAVLSLIGTLAHLKMSGLVSVTGDKGSVGFRITAGSNAPVNKGSSGSETTDLYRVMSNGEYESLIKNKKFTPYEYAMEDKWFATNESDAHKWAEWFYPDGNYKIVKFEIYIDKLTQMFYSPKLDNIGPAYCSPIDLINSAIKSMMGI